MAIIFKEISGVGQNYEAIKFLSLAKSFFDSEVNTVLNAL